MGLKAYIDNTDLVMSGFCNDLQDFSQIYWLCENFNGMTDDELQEFLVKLNLYHIAGADTSEGGKITPLHHRDPCDGPAGAAGTAPHPGV